MAKSGSPRGFAAMDPQKQRIIASAGGRAAHEKGTGHEFTPDEAWAAGRMGGEAISMNRQHMAEIGRKGGLTRSRRRRQAAEHPICSHAPNQGFVDRLPAVRVDLVQEDSLTPVDVTRDPKTTFHRAADLPIFLRNRQFFCQGQQLAQDPATADVAAIDRFLALNDGLARWLAKRFIDTGIDRDDLLQIARLGLIRAAPRFDVTCDTALSASAIHWLQRSCIYEVPAHVFPSFILPSRFWRYYRLKRRAARRPLTRGRRTVPAWRQRRFVRDPLVGRWVRNIEPIWNITSIDQSGESRRAAYSLASPLPGPFKLAAQDDLNQLIRRTIDQLHPTDAHILRARFALDRPVETLKELAITFGVTRERIRQREVDALKRLRKRLNRRLEFSVPPSRDKPLPVTLPRMQTPIDSQTAPDCGTGFPACPRP